MKFDPATRSDIGTRRTLRYLKKALLDLMIRKAFDKITVIDICNESMVPRATFYNYFEDKYSLLDYCMDEIISEMMETIKLEYSAKAVIRSVTISFDFIERHVAFIRTIVSKNSGSGQLMQLAEDKIRRNMEQSFLECPGKQNLTYDPAIIAGLCSNISIQLLVHKLANIDTFTAKDAERFILDAVNFPALGMVI